jgi:competence protein ComFC
MDKLFNLLFPPKCLFCNRVGDIFCDYCLAECLLLNPQYCVVCDQISSDGFTHKNCKGANLPSQSISVYLYTGKIRDCIKFSKYGPKQFAALKKLSDEAGDIAFEWNFIDFSNYVCIPIPVSAKKEAYRGFNQAELIAKTLSWKFNLKYEKSILTRLKDTRSQFNLNRKERFQNLLGSFACTASKVCGRKFLLVDDVCTTGATFLEAARVLYLAGAVDVKCFSLSKKVL